MSGATNVFNAYSRYYDLLYGDKDYSAEVDYICRLLSRHGIGGGELLEFGSGTGRHGRLLAEKGPRYRVLGIERSAEMLARAVPSDRFSCIEGDICAVRLGRTFDAVLALFHVVSYQVSNTAVRGAFASAAAHLRPGGLFIFDVWYTPAVYAQRPEARVKRMADSALEITRTAAPSSYPNENRVDVHYAIQARDRQSGALHEFTETHSMRHFSLPELDLLAEGIGFERLRAEEFLTGKEPGEETWGVCLVLKRK